MTIPTSSLRDAVRYLAKQPSNRLTRKPAPNAALVQLCAVSRQSLTLLGLGKVARRPESSSCRPGLVDARTAMRYIGLSSLPLFFNLWRPFAYPFSYPYPKVL